MNKRTKPLHLICRYQSTSSCWYWSSSGMPTRKQC